MARVRTRVRRQRAREGKLGKQGKGRQAREGKQGKQGKQGKNILKIYLTPSKHGTLKVIEAREKPSV